MFQGGVVFRKHLHPTTPICPAPWDVASDPSISADLFFAGSFLGGRWKWLRKYVLGWFRNVANDYPLYRKNVPERWGYDLIFHINSAEFLSTMIYICWNLRHSINLAMVLSNLTILFGYATSKQNSFGRVWVNFLFLWSHHGALSIVWSTLS